MRLNANTLQALPAAVKRPNYDRHAVVPGIVHLGVGAFHRAHQALFTEAVLASGDLAWGIVGAGTVSDKTKRALAPQDGLYTLVETAASSRRLRVVGSIVEVLGGPEDLPTLLERMSAPTTRIVSLTVTEKGYCLDAATGELQFDSPAITRDLAHPLAPQTVLGLIVQALGRRRAAGTPPFTVLSCDNLPSNGRLARTAVIAFARRLDSALADWIDAEVAFPCTMVDRITPATTDADRGHVSAEIGLEDAWPVVAEDFVQWVIEDRFTMGRPDWSIHGAIFSDEIECWENMKLRCLNGAHSALAYLGQLAGRETVADAMGDPMITGVLDQLWAEIREVLHAPRGVDTAAYVESLKTRFCNASIRHRTMQIAMDGSQKLPQRLLAPLRDRIAKGLPSPAIAIAIAAWMHYVSAKAYGNSDLADPLGAEILARARLDSAPASCVANLLAIQEIFGMDLSANTRLRDELVAAFVELARNPNLATAHRLRADQAVVPSTKME